MVVFFIMRSTCNSSFQETEVKIKHGMIRIIFLKIAEAVTNHLVILIVTNDTS